MRISDWSSDVCSSDLGLAWEHLVSWMENGAGTARSWARRTGSTGFDIPDPTRGWRSARALRGGVTWRRPRIAASKNESELGPFPSPGAKSHRSEEHTTELQSLMRI